MNVLSKYYVYVRLKFFFRSDTIALANEDFQKVLKNASECSSSTTNTTQWKLKLFDVVAFSGTNK